MKSYCIKDCSIICGSIIYKKDKTYFSEIETNGLVISIRGCETKKVFGNNDIYMFKTKIGVYYQHKTYNYTEEEYGFLSKNQLVEYFLFSDYFETIQDRRKRIIKKVLDK